MTRLPRIEPAAETRRITAFIKSVVRDASAKGVVVGLSGGIDSAVTGALCVRALGAEGVLGLLLPSDHTPADDVKDANALAAAWGIRTETIPISGIVDSALKSTELQGTRLARANLQARTRMLLLYYHANSLGYLVAGTDDRSESLLGFFTKFGDGGVDFLPISHLYKTQVRELGASLGVPTSVVEKPASPQLWPGHKATDEIPADYDKLDVLLHCIFDLKMKGERAARESGLPTSVVDGVMAMYRKTEHKRTMPPSLA